MVKKEVLANLIDSKKASILRIILNSKDEMYLKEIAEKSKVSITSTFRILNELVNLQILQRREWKTSKVYSSSDNEKVKFLKELFYEEFDGIKNFVDLTKDIAGIQSIILHGKQQPGKANLLIIGDAVNSKRIDEICQEIKEKNFELSFLTLTAEQYEQMAKMGLYSLEKKVLK